METDTAERQKPEGGIQGTPIFDGTSAQKGYALNKLCFSFNDPENRAAFLRDEDAYCKRFGLNQAQLFADVAYGCVLIDWRLRQEKKQEENRDD